jgi:prepilin-type N-terminal cleavage/methylation domain-containing protein
VSVDRDGFTLIEVLVGMVVAALALSAGFAALAFVKERADQAEAAMVPAVAGAGTRALLTEWLAGARLRAPGRGERFPEVSGMELRYLPDVQDASEWLPSWVDARSLPLAVELSLSATLPDSLPDLLEIPLRVPLEAGR